MDVSPITLEGQHVRLEPLSTGHHESLLAAAGDGELWNSIVTVVPGRDTMTEYIRKHFKDSPKAPVAIRNRSQGVR